MIGLTLLLLTTIAVASLAIFTNLAEDSTAAQSSTKEASPTKDLTEESPKKETRTVKVAITRDGFWFPSRTSSAINGYGGEYLKALEKKTGWTFVTKVYPLSEAYKALQSGEVDIMAPVSYSKERAEQLMLMDTPSGATRITFYTTPKSMLAYRDYKSFSGKKIAIIKGSNSEFVVKRDAELNNYTFVPYYCADNRELLEAISTGKADIVVAQSMCVSNKEQLKVVNELQESNFFFATATNNLELARKLNNAINSILLANPEFNNTLSKRYLEPTETAEPRFTQDEISYLHDAPTIRVAYVKNYQPFQFTADKKITSQCGIGGISGRALDIITAKTGLKFSSVAYSNLEDAEDGVKTGEADIVAQYLPPEESFATDGKIISTATFLNSPIVTIGTKNDKHNDTPIIGVPYDLRWATPILREEHKKYNYVGYSTQNDAIEALRNGQITGMLTSSVMAESILSNAANSSFKISDYSALVHKLCFGVSAREDENLVRVINKTIASFDCKQRNVLTAEKKELSVLEKFYDFVRGNWIALLLGIAVLFAIIFGILFNARRQNLKEVEYIAFIDPITGLPNRSKFIEYVGGKIERDDHIGGAVAVMDIDSFKSINDMYGMSFGDELLKHLGEKLALAAPDKTFIARDSGDMFLVYFEPASQDELNDTVLTLINSISRVTFKHAGLLDLSVSCGVYLLSNNENPNASINCADIARVNIKDDHGKHVMFFNEEMRAELANQTILENDLKLALERKEFELYYQPKIDLFTQRVVGFEALIRWNHPLAGVLGPAAFIPLAEKVGLIGQITSWVINESCANIAHLKELWSRSEGIITLPETGKPYGVKAAINLSPRDLLSPHICDQVKEALAVHNVKAAALEIEITESALLGNTQTCLQVLNELRGMGITVALDDFGTGYSSLGSLKDLPLNTVKLDRIFIRDIEIDARAQKMLKSIVNLVKGLDYSLVAEGVEDAYQADFLKNIGCEVVQGFYYAPGMPLGEAYQYYIASLNSPIEPE